MVRNPESEHKQLGQKNVKSKFASFKRLRLEYGQMGTMRFSLLLLYSALVACTHSKLREAPSSLEFERNFVTLKSVGLASLRCQAHFPPLKFLANYLERAGQISRAAATRLRDPYAYVNFFPDNTPCLIQQTARPDLPDTEARKTVDHFASVASAAVQGTCQMLALGYLSLPIDLTSTREKWRQDPVNQDWLLDTNEGGGQKLRFARDFKTLEIRRVGSEHPFIIRFSERTDNRLIPVKVESYLEGEGPLEYTASYEDIALNGRPFPVPLTTTLIVRKVGREGVRMSTEYSCKLGP